jgi:hypothetical protein
MRRASLVTLLASLSCVGMLGLLGCSSPSSNRAVVKGEVSLGGKKLNMGSVLFSTKDNRTATATIDPNGNYEMKDAPIGQVDVAVIVPKGGKMMSPMAGKGVAPKGIGEMKSPEGQGTGLAFDPSKMTIVEIPDKYSNLATSGLTFKVEKGEQTINIPLTP